MPAPVPSSSEASPETGWFGLYYGWYNVLLSMAAIAFVVGSTSYSFGLFIKPASEALHLSRANTNLGLVCFTIGNALASPIVGRMLDRTRLILVMRVAVLVFGATLVALSLCTSPILIALLMLIPLPASAAAAGGLFGSVLVSRWFTANRGRAITLMWLGTSIGGLLVFPLNAWLLSLFGWRGAIAAIGVVNTIAVLIVSCFIRPSPKAIVATAASKDRPLGHVMGWYEVLAQRDFWLIALPVALLLCVDQTMLATYTPYALDRGFSLAAAAGMMSAMNISGIAGKFGIAFVADRPIIRFLLALTGVFGVIQCLCLIADPDYAGLILVAVLTGMAMGMTMPLANVIASKRFGAASVGTVMGLLMPMTMLLAMFALYFIGAVHDRTGSYAFAFEIFCGLCVIAILLLPFARETPPRGPAEA